MSNLALVTVVCPDRVGLVSAISGELFGHGINLRDVTFASLGQGADFSAVGELPAGLSVAELDRALKALPELAGAQVEAKPFAYDPNPGPLGQITHRVEVSGGDQPGLIARLSEIFGQFGANIVRLDAQTVPEGRRYSIRFAVSIPAERAGSCLAAVANTAEALGLQCRAEGA